MELIEKWITIGLLIIAVSGSVLGVLSFISPALSLRLYQVIMAFFNWRVEPIDLKKELLTTRSFGLLMIVLSVAIFFVLFRSGWSIASIS
jgi:hypothetical protein